MSADKPEKVEKSQDRWSTAAESLERAARAARQLDDSRHAKEALDLARVQEQTKREEMQLRKAEALRQTEQLKVERERVMGEERRKSLEHEARTAKAKADYQDSLARKRDEANVQTQRKLNAEKIQMQEEGEKRQAAIRVEAEKRIQEERRRTLEAESKAKRDLERERILNEFKGKVKLERENEDVHRRQMVERIKAEGEEKMQRLRYIFENTSSGLKEYLTDRERMTNTVLVTSALAVGFYAAKYGVDLARWYAKMRLGTPALVRDTSRTLSLRKQFRVWKEERAAKDLGPMGNVIMDSQMEKELSNIAISTSRAIGRGSPFRNYLFYGPPGTGKTMFARHLAKQSGLHYAIMSGSDVRPLGPKAIDELHKLFDWAEHSRKGLVLFIDEADAFLQRRDSPQLGEDMRTTLNAFLQRTGAKSKKFSFVLATNRPQDLDTAVLHRVGEAIHFDVPGLAERVRLAKRYFDLYVISAINLKKSPISLHKDFDYERVMQAVGEKTTGFAGREIEELMVATQYALYESETGVLTEEMVASVMAKHVQRQGFVQGLERGVASFKTTGAGL